VKKLFSDLVVASNDERRAFKREDLQESLRSDAKRARSDDECALGYGSATVGQVGYDTCSQNLSRSNTAQTPRGRGQSSIPSFDLTPSFVTESNPARQPQADPRNVSGVSEPQNPLFK